MGGEVLILGTLGLSLAKYGQACDRTWDRSPETVWLEVSLIGHVAMCPLVGFLIFKVKDKNQGWLCCRKTTRFPSTTLVFFLERTPGKMWHLQNNSKVY